MSPSYRLIWTDLTPASSRCCSSCSPSGGILALRIRTFASNWSLPSIRDRGFPPRRRTSPPPIRPDPAGTPTVVSLTMVFQDISRLNEAEQTMTADVYILARWRDPRLAAPARRDGSADCAPPGKGLWMPAVEPENLRSRQASYSQRFLVDANGTVTLVQRLVRVRDHCVPGAAQGHRRAGLRPARGRQHDAADRPVWKMLYPGAVLLVVLNAVLL